MALISHFLIDPLTSSPLPFSLKALLLFQVYTDYQSISLLKKYRKQSIAIFNCIFFETAGKMFTNGDGIVGPNSLWRR